MKVLLIQPPSCDPLADKFFLFEPLALEYLGAGLKLDGHTVEILDARLDSDIEGAFTRFQPQMVGVTGFTSHVNIVKRIAARLKALDPGIHVVVGGHHATVQPEDFNEPAFDAVVIGEGVFTLREIVSAIASGSSMREIAGIAMPNAKGMFFSAARRYTDLDALPFPDRTLTSHYRKHYFSEWFKPLASIRTSLGCTARCSFCALWSITGGKYLRRDPVAVVEELRTIAEPNVFFCDDESMCDAKRMSRLAAMNKGVTTAQQVQAVQILDSLGVMMYASYMVDPAYTREDFRSLLAYVRRLKHKYATFTVMTPLPGTRLHKERERELLSRKPELYDMLHVLLPTRLPPAEFYQELATLWTKAVPFHRIIPTLVCFGLRGMLQRIRLFGIILKRIRAAHLDY